MGQYWYPVNLDKHEFVHPHKLATGLTLWEQFANHPGTAAALIILCAAMPKVRGKGDFDLDENRHGPECTFPEHNCAPGPLPKDYPIIAKRTIGRWAGDRIALVGDYAEDSDLAPEYEASGIYDRCGNGEWLDISEDVCRVIEHELCGKFKFSGWGWRKFTAEGEM